MLRQCLLSSTRQRLLVSASSTITKNTSSRALPVQVLRQAFTSSAVTQRNEPKMREDEEEKRTWNRRYVEVESPLAKANKYTYAMPDDPYVASERVGRILEIGTVDDAADYIKALPIYLQSAVVWNQLLGYCAKYGRANYAEQYYAQMRKRGLEPNERTFTHLLTAYAKSNSPHAIKHAEAWIKKMKSDFNLDPSTIHMNNLMRVYNNADQPEKTIEALNKMSSTAILAPDAVTYSIALQGCVNLNRLDRAEQVRRIWHEIIYRMERHQRHHTGTSALSRKASEIVWAEESLSARDTDLEIDDSLVVTLLNSVTRTSANELDVLTGIEAIDRIYSLCPPRAADMMTRNAMHRKPGFGFQPSVKVLDAILRFSGGLREYQLGKEYYNLALQQYPSLKPDKYVLDAYAYIEKQLKRQHNYQKKNKKRQQEENYKRSSSKS